METSMPVNHAQLAKHPFVRWSIMGGVFGALGLGLLHVFFAVLHYLLAAILAAACSGAVSVLSNFWWVWRKRASP